MAWRDAGLEIVIAIIGTGLLGTSLSTYYDNVYYQPFIDISVQENQNEKLLDRSSYYEITFKNTGQKSASNLQINIFFFANITNYTPIIHGEKPIFNLDSNISQNNNLIKLSLLHTSISKFPKDDLIILYVWTNPWSINKERSSTNDEYYITATYDEGSNHVASFNKKNTDLNSFFPHIEVDTGNTLSIQNVPFITILLSILTFAILFKIHRTKSKNKALSMNRLDYYQNNEGSNQKVFQYDLFVLLPIIFVSSTVILFTIEIPLQNLIFSFLPHFSLDLTTHIPINNVIGISEDIDLPVYLILIFSFFGSLVILLIRSIVTYTICIFILKYIINENIDISFRLGEGKNKKLFLLSLITMSFPLYTTIYYSLADVFSSYNNLLYFMIIVEFIRLTSLLILNKLSIDKNKLVTNLVRTSRIFCFTSGLLYILISAIIGNKIMDIYSISTYSIDEFYSSIYSLLFQDHYILPVFFSLIFSLIFFFIVGIIQISWAYLLRKRTNSILYSLEFAGLIIMTIIWISLRVFLPLAIANPTNTIAINYFAFLHVVPLILNLGTIILCLQLLTILIDYLIVKRESILLKIKKSRITNPKLIVSLLSIIIVSVLVPIIFFISSVTDTFSKNYFPPDYSYLIDRSPLFTFIHFSPKSSASVNEHGVFFFSPKSSASINKTGDCIGNFSQNNTYMIPIIESKCMNLYIVNLDFDPINRELILLFANKTTTISDPIFSIGIINLEKYVDDFTVIPNLNANIIYDIDISPNNNRLYILHDKNITEVDLSTKKIINSSVVRTISKKIVVDFVDKQIFLLNSRGLDIINMDTKEQLSHINLQGVGEDIEYDSNNRKLYLSVTNSYKSYIYIVEPSLLQILTKLEIKGYPLHLGIQTDSEPFIHNTILLLTKGPNGIREYGFDESGDVQSRGFKPIYNLTDLT